MKSLQQHIYENNFHKSGINEKLIINKNFSQNENLDDLLDSLYVPYYGKSAQTSWPGEYFKNCLAPICSIGGLTLKEGDRWRIGSKIGSFFNKDEFIRRYNYGSAVSKENYYELLNDVISIVDNYDKQIVYEEKHTSVYYVLGNKYIFVFMGDKVAASVFVGLRNSVNEKLIINKEYKSDDYFIYKIYDVSPIRIFNGSDWSLFNKYRNKVYINGEHVELDNGGYTKMVYKPGEYKVEIKDINGITYCGDMFKMCISLKNVPLFDTSKVLNMNKMFYGCKNLEEVQDFDTSKVKNMNLMFYNCYNLNEETKQWWSQIYDFNTDEMK